MTEMLLAGHGLPVTVRAPVIGQLVAWTAHRSRRVTPHGHEEPAASVSWTGRFPA
jgi:hypothetical protein